MVVVGMSLAAACGPGLPEIVVLRPEATEVEVTSEAPNPDAYESVGEVTAEVIGTDASTAVQQAQNELRNQAAAKGATFVSVNLRSTRSAGDMSGRTIVALVGTAYRSK